MRNNVKITVLMPAFNASAYIRQAIRSVLDQTFGEFELLIIDDGSTDGTAAVVRSFDDPRIVFIRQANAGVAAALNLGLLAARSDYIARFDADDICYANRLEQQYAFMIANPECIVLGSAVDYVDQSNEFIYTHQPPADTDAKIRGLPYSVCPFIHSSVLFRRSIAMAAGGYSKHAHSFEDHLLWLQIINEGEFRNISQSLMRVRINPQSLTVDEKWRPKQFIAIKYKCLNELCITPEDADTLLTILKKQDTAKIKTGSYYALLAKKFLWNNYQPLRARRNIRKAIAADLFHIDNYFVLIMSFLPRDMVSKIYAVVKTKRKSGPFGRNLFTEKLLQ